MDPLDSMNLSAAAADRTDGQLESLRMMSLQGKSKLTDKRMKEIGDEFETLLFRQLLKEMRKTIPKDGIFEQSHATEMYNDIGDDFLAKQLAEGQEFGIDKQIYDELKEKNDKTAEPDQAPDASFKSLNKKGEGTPQFIPLNQKRDRFFPIHSQPKMMDLNRKEYDFMPLASRPRIPSDKIKNE
ncbi:MAG: rod-binding protein [Candidatus Omnitrophota bacterium]